MPFLSLCFVRMLGMGIYMNRISKEKLSVLRKKYSPGRRVKLVRMNDPYITIEEGVTGTVVMVDDIGTIHVKWDSGSCLGIVFGEDNCEPI